MCRNIDFLAGVVDFYCPPEKLIIELGGDPLGDSIQIPKDMTRDKYLEALVFTCSGLRTGLSFRNPKNQPPRPGKQNCKHLKIMNPGHPSFKRRGNLFVYKPANYSSFRY